MSQGFGDLESRLLREGRGPGNLRELLACIKRRPAMYLGEKSLTALGHLLHGYAAACHHHGIAEGEGLELSGLEARFVRWLEERKGVGYGSCGPIEHLKQICENEAVAVDRFFELLEEYEASGDRCPERTAPDHLRP